MTKRNPRDQKKVGNCVVAERADRKQPYERSRQRLKEIERLIADRYGRFLPATYLPAFLEVVGLCHRDRSATLEWTKRYAPGEIGSFDAIFEPIAREVARRRWNLSDEDAGRHLSLTRQERSELKISTMWASDLSLDEQKAQSHTAKKERDRLRREKERRAKRIKTRSEYLAERSHRPWEADGISKATYHRRKRAERETSPSPPTQKAAETSPSRATHIGETGPSPTENTHRVFDTGTGDTPVSPTNQTSRINSRPKRRPAHKGAGVGAQLDLFADGGTTT